MQQIWSTEELQEHWALSDEELLFSESVIEPRRLMLCYYLKYFQLTAKFPNSVDFNPELVLEFLAHQIGSEFSQLPLVPNRSDRRYRRQIIEFLNLGRFDWKARTAFVNWLICDVLPAAPNASALETQITN